MTLDLGLDTVGLQRLIQTLSMDHCRKITVTLLDLDHNYLMDLSNRLYDGQVNISTSNTISRSSSLAIWDPMRNTGIDDLDPNVGAKIYDKMIKVVYSVWRYGDTSSVDIPLFCGPITSIKRKGGYLNMACVGKEALAMHNVYYLTKYREGLYKRNIALALIRDRSGETKFSMEYPKSKAGKDYVYSLNHIVWTEVQKLAKSLGYYVFYDGRGVLRMRKYPSTVAFIFRDGPGGTILEEPELSFDDQEIRNIVRVTGAKPRGAKRAAFGQAVLPKDHPLYHYEIGRRHLTEDRTVPRIYLEQIEDTSLTKDSQCKTRAESTLRNFAYQQIAASANVMAIPFLEEGDLVGLQTSEYYMNMRYEEATIPLIGSPGGSVGSNKNLAIKKRV